MNIPVTYARYETLRAKPVHANFRHNHEWYRIHWAGNEGDPVQAIKTQYRHGPRVKGTAIYTFVEEEK